MGGEGKVPLKELYGKKMNKDFFLLESTLCAPLYSLLGSQMGQDVEKKGGMALDSTD